MKAILFVFLIVYSRTASSKTFGKCELVRELYQNHIVPANEIYKHICVTTLNTSQGTSLLGIYGIADVWCSWQGQGGTCSINCNKLLDDDITDDVVCMQIIMEQQGLEAWGRSRTSCLRNHLREVTECFRAIRTQSSIVRYD